MDNIQYQDELNNAGYLATEDEVRAGYSEAMLYGLVIACSIPLIMDTNLDSGESVRFILFTVVL